MKVVRFILLAALLVGCRHPTAQPTPQTDQLNNQHQGAGPARAELVSRVLFTANGSYDASADSRTRQGKGIRRVQWLRHPPLAASEVTVDYDSDARPLAWTMTVQQPGFDPKTLVGQNARSVQTRQGAGLLATSGDLKDTLILTGKDSMTLYSHGYVVQHAPQLLSAYLNTKK